MVHLNLPPNQAFDVVLTGLDTWVKDVERVEWDHTASTAPGVLDTGSLRTCLFGEKELTERIEYIEPGKVYAYTIVEERSNIPLPPNTNRLNVMMVESDGNGGSIVTWRFYFDKTFHPVSPVLETVMKRAFIYNSIQTLVDKNGGEVISPDLSGV